MPVFNLIDYINKEITNRDIEMSAFNTCPTGNKVLFNSAKQKDICVISAEYANKHRSELGFPVEAGIADGDNAVTLLKKALSTVMHWRFISIWSDRSNIKSQSFCTETYMEYIARGKSKLPELKSDIFEFELIGQTEDNGLVNLGYMDPNQPISKTLLYETFVSVIMILPPP